MYVIPRQAGSRSRRIRQGHIHVPNRGIQFEASIPVDLDPAIKSRGDRTRVIPA